jgi:HlyD family secretion protein
MSAALQPIQPPAPPAPVASPLEPRKPSRAWFLWLVLLAIAGGAAYWYATRPSQRSAAALAAVRTVKVEAGPVVRTLRVTGQTSARSFSQLTAPVLRGPEARALILMYLAPSGTWVRKGQKIAEIDGQSMQDHVDDLAETIRQAQADIANRKVQHAVEWENQEQTLRVRKAALDKARLDYQAAEVRTDVEREILKLAVEENEARYNQELKNAQKRKEVQAAEMRILEITEERHTRHRNRHVIDLTRFTLYAPTDGLFVVQTIFRGGDSQPILAGDQLSPGQPFAKIVDPRTMQLEAQINQAETSELRIGQPVRIAFDAFPGLTLPGSVYSIGALAVSSGRTGYYIRAIPVRIAIDGSDPRVIPDLSASGDVQLARMEASVRVPLAALKTEGGKPVAYVRTAKGFEKRPVEIAARNNIYASVVSGLRAGEEVRLD